MADVSVTAAEVLPISGQTLTLKQVTWGGTVTAGMGVYETTAGTYAGTDSDALASAAGKGIAMSGGAAGQVGLIALPGSVIDPGFTVTVAESYYASSDAGGLAPSGDLANPDYKTEMLLGITASSARVICEVSGVQVPV